VNVRWAIVLGLAGVATVAWAGSPLPSPEARPEPGPTVVSVDRLFTRGLAPLDLGATPDDQRSAGACGECHSEIWDEWAASRHAVAWTNGIFQREFKLQPLDWCVRCHAPLAKRPGDIRDTASVGPVESQGVNCAVCHLRDGQMLATSKRPDSPHDTRVVPEMESADYCAGCHQFNFPFIDADHQVTRYTDHPMQSTVAEFRAGERKDQPGECLGCHGNTPARHRLPGAHSVEVLQHAVQMDVCRVGASVAVSVTNKGAGHAVPTGDLHRHLVLRVWRSSAPERLFEARIGRLFAPAPDSGKVITSDTSIQPGESRRWSIPSRSLGPTDEPLNAELRYVYTADEVPKPGNDPGEPTVVTITSTRLPEVPPCR
jgi:hypothetical protein